MNCEGTRPRLQDYLEDSLPESIREEMRSHLVDCAACREYAEFLGTFASHLRRMAHIEVPFDLADAVKKELEHKSESRTAGSVSRNWTTSK